MMDVSFLISALKVVMYMPKTKLQSHMKERKKPLVPPPNYVAELFWRYAKAQQMNSSCIGQALGVSGSAVRHALSRPVVAWTIGEIYRYCNALNVPTEDALMAASESIRR